MTPDVAVPEVMNAFFVQEHVLHLIEDGAEYLDVLFDLVESEQIRVVATSRGLMQEAYRIASRQKGGTYDCLFVALAKEMKLRLLTIDARQARMMEIEGARDIDSGGPGA